MSEENKKPGVVVDIDAARGALRAELIASGYEVASDTMSRGRDLYVIGDNDLARALFVFGTDAGDTAETMYLSSGSWTAGMPPRFAVLPGSEVDNPSFEMLEQIRAIPLLFDMDGDQVRFRSLSQLLSEHLNR